MYNMFLYRIRNWKKDTDNVPCIEAVLKRKDNSMHKPDSFCLLFIAIMFFSAFAAFYLQHTDGDSTYVQIAIYAAFLAAGIAYGVK